MSSRNIIALLVAIIGAAGVIIAALIGGIFSLLVEQTKINAAATNVAATFVAYRTVDAPLSQQPYSSQPTFTRLPTQQPYTLIPTPKPNVTVVTPKPFIITATPSADQQNPPPGSIISAGQGYTRNGVTVTLLKKMWFSGVGFNLYFLIENQNRQQIIVLWKNSFLHAQDDKGKVYRQKHESSQDWNRNKQLTIEGGDAQQIDGFRCCYNTDNGLDEFVGGIDSAAKYLIVTFDQIAGMTNIRWRYDLP